MLRPLTCVVVTVLAVTAPARADLGPSQASALVHGYFTKDK